MKHNTEGAREVRCTLQPLREVWMKVGLEKLDTHEGVTVKALLDSGATGIFMDKDFVEEQGFKLVKLGKPIEVKNVDGTDNNGDRIEYEIEYNMYFKGHVEKIRVDVCKLGRMKDDEVSTMVYTEQGEEEGKEKDKGSRTDGGRIGTKEVLEVEEGVWKSRVRKDVSAEALGSCNRAQGRLRTKEGKSVLTFQG